MAYAKQKLGFFPVIFCLVGGVSYGLIYICHKAMYEDVKLQEPLPTSETPDVLFKRAWSTQSGLNNRVQAPASEQHQEDDANPINNLLFERSVPDVGGSAYTASEKETLLKKLRNSQTGDIQSDQSSMKDELNHLSLQQNLQEPIHVDSSSSSSRVDSLRSFAVDSKTVEDLPEDIPEENILEDGQDQNPQETEMRAKKQSALDVQRTLADYVQNDPELSKLDLHLPGSEGKDMKASKAKEESGDIKVNKVSVSELKSIVEDTTHKASTSIAALAAAGLKGDNNKLKAKRVKPLTATEEKFMFQMSDMLAAGQSGGDSGGASLKMNFLTEEEANAVDAQEYNSRKAYGVREEELVVFLQVSKGMVEQSINTQKARQRAAAEGLPLLSMDIVKKQVVKNLVLVTCASWSHYDFALNWVIHLQKLGVDNFLVGALDKQTSQGLAALGVPGFRMFPDGEGTASLSSHDFKSSQENTHRLSRQKVALSRLFTDFGYDVIVNDVDSVWLADPRSYFHNIPRADILTASDELSTTLEPGDHGLELVQAIRGLLSMSVLYLRHSAAVTAFVKEWDAILAGDSSRVDQLAFNTLVIQYTHPLQSLISNPRLATGPQQKLCIGVLPVALFTNGHTYFVQQLHKKHGAQPFSVHVNFVEGGLRGKRHRLREAGLWEDSGQYFNGPSGFVQVTAGEPEVMPEDLDETAMINLHVSSLSRQLAQIRAGIALAVALQRTLILPKLTCYCDRAWDGVEECRAPGANGMSLPFSCPLDYVLNPNYFDDAGSEHGLRIDFREHSFLDRAQHPRGFKESMIVITPTHTDSYLPLGALFTLAEKLPIETTHLELPPRLPDDELGTALEDHASVKVLAFTDAANSFGGFRDLDWARAVARRVARLQDTWCCRATGQPRSVVYSMESSVSSFSSTARL